MADFVLAAAPCTDRCGNATAGNLYAPAVVLGARSDSAVVTQFPEAIQSCCWFHRDPHQRLCLCLGFTVNQVLKLRFT